uniref:Uncharacterized protein n=1 Tax=Nelumbo nucifera TaxID=4432 RepID=A0A822YHI2_NELNU|nr:TPA_asm: hypothetical protein HUJ06_010752 [Nelumbo nucifera]
MKKFEPFYSFPLLFPFTQLRPFYPVLTLALHSEHASLNSGVAFECIIYCLSSSIPASKSRSEAPTRRPSTPSSVSTVSAPPAQSSSTTKPVPTAEQEIQCHYVALHQLLNPDLRSHQRCLVSHWMLLQIYQCQKRPVSASRGRPGAPSSQSSSVGPSSNRRPRRQSCSRSRGRSPNGIIHSSGSSVPAVSRSHSNDSDNVSPVFIGTKERSVKLMECLIVA